MKRLSGKDLSQINKILDPDSVPPAVTKHEAAENLPSFDGQPIEKPHREHCSCISCWNARVAYDREMKAVSNGDGGDHFNELDNWTSKIMGFGDED